MSTYHALSNYNRAVSEIANVAPCPFTGKIDPDAIKRILGEVLDIWPASIADDPEAT